MLPHPATAQNLATQRDRDLEVWIERDRQVTASVRPAPRPVDMTRIFAHTYRVRQLLRGWRSWSRSYALKQRTPGHHAP
jgi:hypothetical protein